MCSDCRLVSHSEAVEKKKANDKDKKKALNDKQAKKVKEDKKSKVATNNLAQNSPSSFSVFPFPNIS